jgi:hypothetical protein
MAFASEILSHPVASQEKLRQLRELHDTLTDYFDCKLPAFEQPSQTNTRLTADLENAERLVISLAKER